jgi:hypothetical protein
VFQILQSHSTWGRFFQTFGYDIKVFLSACLLEVGGGEVCGGQVS